MKILVTGGAGFIGSHVADAYVRAGHRVFVLDNLSSGHKKNVNPQARFFKIDIRSEKAVQRIIKKVRPDVLNHHAAHVSVVESVRYPNKTYETNFIGTSNLLRGFGNLSKPGRRKFIFASTGGALYGEPRVLPAPENTLIRPLAPYGFSKFIAEETIFYCARLLNFSYLVLRYSNVYGPRQDAHGEAGVVAIFSNLLKRNKRPVIYGDGTKTRDYVYVDDVVRANLLALRRGQNICINIGTGKRISDQHVFNEISRHISPGAKPRYAHFRTGEVRHISLSSHLARKTIGWNSRTTFRDGIKKTVA